MGIIGNLFTGGYDYDRDSGELVTLIGQANDWGAQKQWPLPERYPMYSRIRGIGERIHKAGGIKEMRRVHSKVHQVTSLGRLLEVMWDKIGWAGTEDEYFKACAGLVLEMIGETPLPPDIRRKLDNTWRY